jgi:hypothetical protein
MGLGNNKGNKIFVNISKGLFATGSKKNDSIKTFTDLTGSLTDIEIADDTYDNKTFKVLKLTVTDEDGNYELKMRFESAYSRYFCNQIENADLSLPITFVPGYKEENGKKIYKFFLIQSGKPLRHVYTKDNPGALPQLKKVTFKGEDHWDNSGQMAYYTELLIYKIKPQLLPAILAGPASEASVPNGHPRPATNGVPRTAADVTEPIDDLPF